MGEGAENSKRNAFYQRMGLSLIDAEPIDALLKSTVESDRYKLVDICRQFGIPSNHRKLIWKILLGIVPLSYPLRTAKEQWRREQFEVLHRTTKTMYPSLDEELFNVVMFLIWNDRVSDLDDLEILSVNFKDFIAMSATVFRLFDDPCARFWLSVGFFTYYRKSLYKFCQLETAPGDEGDRRPHFSPVSVNPENDEKAIAFMKEQLLASLRRRSEHLCVAMTEHQVLPFRDMFLTVYAGIFPHRMFYERAWSAMIADFRKCCKLTILIAVELVDICCQSQDEFHSEEEITRFFGQLSEEQLEEILNRALEVKKSSFGKVC